MADDIAYGSTASLYLVTRSADHDLGIGTGFVVERHGQPYLISNFHVIAGRLPGARIAGHPSGALPDEVVVLHNVAGHLGTWRGVHEPARDANGPLWLEHPVYGSRVDVVALPLTKTDGYDLYPWTLDGGEDVVIGVTQRVSVVGFPFGKTGGGGFPIWVQGWIASEPSARYDDLPCFLIDSRTRPGLSGAPVIFYSFGGAIQMSDGATAISAVPIQSLLGVYSGRIHEDADIGVVWRREVITELLEGGVRGAD